MEFVVTGYSGPEPTRAIGALTFFFFNSFATVVARLFANALFPDVTPCTLPECPVTRIVLAFRARARLFLSLFTDLGRIFVVPLKKKYGVRTTTLLPTLIVPPESGSTVVDMTRNTSLVVALTTVASHRPGPMRTRSVSAPTHTEGVDERMSATFAWPGVKTVNADDADVFDGSVPE